MPPVQHVAFLELVGGVQQQLPAGQRRVVVNQRGGVLQLIAEPERPARLVERRATPQPATQGLIGQPAVDHQVERRTGRLNAYGGQPVAPEFPNLGHYRRNRTLLTVAADQPADLIAIFAFTQQDGAFHCRTWLQRQRDLQREARIEPRAQWPVQNLVPFERRRASRTAVMTDEARSVTADVNRRMIGRDDGGESEMAREFAVVVLGQQRASRRILLDDQIRRMILRQHPQHQPGVAEQRQPARLAADVAQLDLGDLDRVFAWRE